MRADRLVAVLLLLQARGTTTAAAIAEELEVSERTARRDLEALAMAGVPVYGTRGRGGGWSLVGGARTDLTGFTASEAQALLVAANTGGVGASGAHELSAALRKLIQAMPQTFRSDAEAVARSIHVDPSRWSGPAPHVEPAFLELLQTAVIRNRQIELGYRRPDGESTRRRVHPYGLVTKASVWYLVGGTDRGRRTFRVSRMESVEVLDEPVERPADFDLGEAWRAIKADFGSHLRAQDVLAEATVEGWTLGPLRSLWATTLTVVETLDDGRFLVQVAGASIPILAYGFAGFGSAVEVHGPPLLIDHLGALGVELVERYGAKKSLSAPLRGGNPQGSTEAIRNSGPRNRAE